MGDKYSQVLYRSLTDPALSQNANYPKCHPAIRQTLQHSGLKKDQVIETQQHLISLDSLTHWCTCVDSEFNEYTLIYPFMNHWENLNDENLHLSHKVFMKHLLKHTCVLQIHNLQNRGIVYSQFQYMYTPVGSLPQPQRFYIHTVLLGVLQPNRT